MYLPVCHGTLFLALGEPLFESKSWRPALKSEHVLIKSPPGNPADRQGQEPLAQSLDFILIEKYKVTERTDSSLLARAGAEQAAQNVLGPGFIRNVQGLRGNGEQPTGRSLPPTVCPPPFTLALEPAGLWSSHLVVLMVASLCAAWGALPVCKISRSVDLPWRGGPTRIIFISLHFSALRS